MVEIVPDGETIPFDAPVPVLHKPVSPVVG